MISAFALVLAWLSSAAHAIEYTAQVSAVHAGDGRDCVLYQLKGVASANNSGSPWFALPKSHPTFKETYALLLAAKLTDAQVFVNSNGPFPHTCGHANTIAVIMF